MTKHRLISGEILDLSGLEHDERRYLNQLTEDSKECDYFDLLRKVKGPDALPLRGAPVTPTIIANLVYRVAHDIADRVGIHQGYLLAPGVARSLDVEAGTSLLSLTEAAELIGISRPATHQALVEERLAGQRVGRAWVVKESDAKAFKKARTDSRNAAASSRVRG